MKRTFGSVSKGSMPAGGIARESWERCWERAGREEDG